jgi:hypothetical protein
MSDFHDAFNDDYQEQIEQKLDAALRVIDLESQLAQVTKDLEKAEAIAKERLLDREEALTEARMLREALEKVCAACRLARGAIGPECERCGYEYQSWGRNPNREPTCRTCPYLKPGPSGEDGGWCSIRQNASVASTGGCGLHPSTPKEAVNP